MEPCLPTHEPAPVRFRRLRPTRRAWRLVVLIPPYVLAFSSLFEPWARARVSLVWGVSRSPEAALLLGAGLVIALGAGLVAYGTKRDRTAALVHLAAGILLGAIAYQAFAMVRDAGMRALGLLPLVSTRPGPGLYRFALAAACLVALGLVELAIALVARSRFRRPGAA